MALTSITTVPYLGELFLSGKRPNALLRLLGGLQGGIRISTAKEFPTGVFYSLTAPSQPANLEGANAPAPRTTALSQTTNVVQIFHETATTTYLAQGDKSISGVVPIPQGAAQGAVQNPRTMAFQVMAALGKIGQDANYTFLNGTYANPADPTGTALKTRGINTAIVTNYIDNSGTAGPTAAQYRGFVEALLLQMIQQNGYQVDETFACFAGATEFSNIIAAYTGASTQFVMPETTIVGVRVRQIVTKFGTLMLVLDPDMPAQIVSIFNLGAAGIVGLEVEGKGVLFEEPLAKTGSTDSTQVYGQLGIDHGPEYLHGKMKVDVVAL